MFKRNCPECDKEISYKRIYEMRRAENKKSMCASCNSTEIGSRPDVYAKKSKAMFGPNNPTRRLEVRTKIIETTNRPEIRKARSERMLGDKNPMKLMNVRSKISGENNGMYGNCGKYNPMARLDIKKKHKESVPSGKNHWNWRTRGEKYTQWQEYRLDVNRITRQQPLYILENFDKRGFRNYHIDHIISIYDGFNQKISAKIIGNIKNLRMIWWEDNLHKNRNSAIISK
jgi:hypothetical protein